MAYIEKYEGLKWKGREIMTEEAIEILSESERSGSRSSAPSSRVVDHSPIPFHEWKRIEEAKEPSIWHTREWYYERYGHFVNAWNKAIELLNTPTTEKTTTEGE